jgi:uncharacterized protein (TIGR00730 family)
MVVERRREDVASSRTIQARLRAIYGDYSFAREKNREGCVRSRRIGGSSANHSGSHAAGQCLPEPGDEAMTHVRSLCVLCGSREGADPAFREAATALGRSLAERGIRLIYGGGTIGLMGVIADSVVAAGGEVVGVIPDFLIRYEIGHTQLTELVITESMHDRKRQMFEMADAFVVLPGGLGTLDETFEILTWKQLRLHDSPIIVLDVNGYWAPLVDLIRATILGGFAHPAVAELITVARTPEEVFVSLARAPAPKEEVLTSHL